MKQTKLMKMKPLEYESSLLTDNRIKKIKQKLLQVDWSSTLCESNSDKNFDKFLLCVNNIMDEVSPL